MSKNRNQKTSKHAARRDVNKQSQQMHTHQTEKQVDKTLMDSFPASDPAGNY